MSATVAAPPADPTRWLEAVVEPAQTPCALMLQLPGGARVEVVDEKQAALACANTSW